LWCGLGACISLALVMDKILTGNVWKQVAAAAQAAQCRLVAVAYVSRERHLKLTQGDLLICDASDQAIKMGETSARVLQMLHSRGVEVRSLAGLHAKVAVFEPCAVIGSSNLSAAAEEELTEAALLSDAKQIVAQATAFIQHARVKSLEIDEKFLQRILKIKVRRAAGRRSAGKPMAMKFGNRVWLASVAEVADDSFANEQLFVDRGEKKARSLVADTDTSISWLRFTGTSRFRSLARPGDTVIQIWTSKSEKRIKVLAECPIVLRQPTAHWTRFYLKESDNDQALTWNEFKRQAKACALARFSTNSLRELKPREIPVFRSLWS
jgi:hypothetical protein